MIPVPEALDHLALDFDFSLDALSAGGLFKATIGLRELGFRVEGVAPGITEAMQVAAERCAQRLSQLGYEITAADVAQALEETLVPASPPMQGQASN